MPSIAHIARLCSCPPVRYLTGATGEYLETSTIPRTREIGLLVQPGNQYHKRVRLYPSWGGDNGAFSKHGFKPERFRRMLRRPELAAARDSCVLIAAPDVLELLPSGEVRGDAAKTLEQFPAWAAEIRALGFPVALVAQDGLEDLLDEVPWNSLDALFVGGSTEWKIGPGAQACVQAAKERDKHTHMGRVNSYRRLSLDDDWGCDTVDGTFLKFGPTENVPRLCAWLDKIERKHKR